MRSTHSWKRRTDMPKTVTTTRQLKAPPERVFRAWTDPRGREALVQAHAPDHGCEGRRPLALRSGVAGQALAPLRAVHPPGAPASLRADLDVRGDPRSRDRSARGARAEGRRHRSQVDSFRIARRRGRESPEGLGADPFVARRSALVGAGSPSANPRVKTPAQRYSPASPGSIRTYACSVAHRSIDSETRSSISGTRRASRLRSIDFT